MFLLRLIWAMRPRADVIGYRARCVISIADFLLRYRA